MKILCLTLTIVFCLICSTGLLAQTTQTKSNQSNVPQVPTTQTKSSQSNALIPPATSSKISQIDLMKIWIGTWKAEMGKDIISTMECKSIYNAFEFHSTIETKGKVIVDWKNLVGYDKSSDRMIESEVMNNNSEMTLYSFWFSSPTKCQKIILGDDDNPDKVKIVYTYEFKSPDNFISTEVRNNKTINSYSFQKVK